MFSIFKNKSKDNSIPEWASFFDLEKYNIFIKGVESYFNKKKIEFKIEDGIVIIDEALYDLTNLGLVNVAQTCNLEETEHFEAIIEDHFETVFRSKRFENEIKMISNDFEKIKQYIGVRLYNIDYISYIGKNSTIGKDLTDDIYAMIVFDFPDSISSIKPDQILPWEKSIDELFEIGLANTKSNYPISITKEDFGEFKISFIAEDHFFAPNVVLDIENRPELLGTYGSLVGLPHRHSVLIYPIENLEVVKAINNLIPVIYGMYEEGPGSLSNKLYWYKDQKLNILPYEIGEEKLQFIPPKAFIEMLNELKES